MKRPSRVQLEALKILAEGSRVCVNRSGFDVWFTFSNANRELLERPKRFGESSHRAMKAAGWIERQYDESAKRWFYRITPAGREALAQAEGVGE